MAGIYSQGGSAGHRYAGWLEQVEAKNFLHGGKVFNGSPSAIYVGSNLVWMGGWLSQAAQRAILGAFGDDGKAVINATNAYLKQLAAQGQAGKDKATALAGFINEDPMMVCSLGLSVEGVTMPKRWIITTGNSLFRTTIIPNQDTSVYMHVQNTYHYGRFFMAPKVGSMYCYGLYLGGAKPWDNYNDDVGLNMDLYQATEHFVEKTKTGLIIDGNTHRTYTEKTFTAAYPMEIFGITNEVSTPEYAPEGWKFTVMYGTHNGTDYRFVPYRKKSGNSYTCELLDIVSMEVQTRVGSFTIEYTLPDGTPWTPSTP